MSTHPVGAAAWQRVVAAQHHRQALFAERTATRLPGWRTRVRRHLVVRATVVGLLLMLVGAVVSFVGVHRAPWLFLATWVGGTLLALGGWFVLRVLTSNVAELPVGMLDEREADQRNAARTVGFGVTLWTALVPLALLLVGTSADEPSTLGFPAALLLTLAILLGGLTPTLLLAWSAPDPDPADTDEHTARGTPARGTGQHHEGTRE